MSRSTYKDVIASEKKYLKECERLFEWLEIDYSGDTITVNDGHTMVIANNDGNYFHQSFVGQSVLEIIEKYAQLTGKNIRWN